MAQSNNTVILYYLESNIASWNNCASIMYGYSEEGSIKNKLARFSDC